MPRADGLLLVAHRGLSGRYPENTLASFRAAAALGARAVEFDVQQSLDGELVVVHDTNLKRVARLPLRVGELTAAELGRLDAGSWFSEEFAGEGIPRLGEVLQVVGGMEEIHLEIKQPRRPYEGIEERVLAVLRALGPRRENVIVSSFHFPTLERLRALAPRARLGWLAGGRSRPAEIARALELGAESIHIDLRRASGPWVWAARDKGLRVLVYTPNTRRALDRLESMGVHGAFTDFPDLRSAVGQEAAA